jgi:hypothetical protein
MVYGSPSTPRDGAAAWRWHLAAGSRVITMDASVSISISSLRLEGQNRTPLQRGEGKATLYTD